VRRGSAGLGKAWHGTAGQARQGKAGHGMAGHGQARRGRVFFERRKSMENKTTVRELSELWGIDDETIKRAIRILFPELMEIGKTTYLTEFHVAVIKEKVVENKRIDLLFKESVTVGADDDLAIIRGLQAAQRKIEKLDAQIAEMKPAHEFGKFLIDARDGWLSMMEAAAVLEPELKMGRNTFLAWLRGLKFLNDRNIPYRDFIECGYFMVTETVTPVGPKTVTKLSNKGMQAILKKFHSSVLVEK